jgi:carboxymethylenebutenolidase
MPKADAEKVAAAFPDLPIYFYEADHGFNCDVREAYHEPSAKQAMERTLSFFAENID